MKSQQRIFAVGFLFYFPPMPKRPNILFLMSDEHRPDVTGYEGNTIVRTPVLDELAHGGVVFRNAYTPSPICIPGRQALMAGQFPRNCGCETFGDDLPPFSMTWAKRLSQRGYQTTCSGKLHHTGADQMQGWTTRIAPDCHVTPRYIDGFQAEQIGDLKAEAGCGKWSNHREIEQARIAYGANQRFDDRATQAALDWVEDTFVAPHYDRPTSHLPHCLKLSLLQPHYPFFTDEAKFKYYLNRVPINVDLERFDHPVLEKTQAGRVPVTASARDVRRATAAYYGMVETVDSLYGNVLRALENAGQNLDEWIIVYTSDHGEMLGQHGIWEKTSFFEGSVRVPLIIRWPEKFAPRVVDENVNLCDLFATLCDLAEVPLPNDEATVFGKGLDSRSLVPLMNGETARWDNETVSQLRGKLMIKRDDLKYCYYPDAPEVLFDLSVDNGETRNLIDEPRHAEAVAAFRARRAELGY